MIAAHSHPPCGRRYFDSTKQRRVNLLVYSITSRPLLKQAASLNRARQKAHTLFRTISGSGAMFRLFSYFQCKIWRHILTLQPRLLMGWWNLARISRSFRDLTRDRQTDDRRGDRNRRLSHCKCAESLIKTRTVNDKRRSSANFGWASHFFLKNVCMKNYISCPNITRFLPEKYFFSRVWRARAFPAPPPPTPMQ